MESTPGNMETNNSVDGEATDIWGVHHPICGAIFPFHGLCATHVLYGHDRDHGHEPQQHF